jgi:ABC-type sugar transport system substrate-binding protein
MKRILFAVLTLAMVAGLVGCAPAATPAPAAPAAAEATTAPAVAEATTAPAAAATAAPAAGKKVKIGLSMDSLESAFWVANHNAMQAKAKELGVEMVEAMAEGDPNKQNQQVENLIAQGVTALIIAPKDGAAIEAAVKKAKEANIPVIMNNRPVQGDVKPDLQILSDNYTMAKQALQWFVDKAKAEKKTYKALLLIGSLGDENAVEREKGHKEVLDANKDVIQVVAEVPTEWKHEVALAGMQNAFQANPDINLIITPSDFLFPPIKSVLEQTNHWKKIGEDGHVAIVSFDGDEVGMQYLKDGYNWVDAAQSADATGNLAVEWAVKLSNGEKPDSDTSRDPGIIANVDNCKEICPKVWGWSLVK